MTGVCPEAALRLRPPQSGDNPSALFCTNSGQPPRRKSPRGRRSVPRASTNASKSRPGAFPGTVNTSLAVNLRASQRMGCQRAVRLRRPWPSSSGMAPEGQAIAAIGAWRSACQAACRLRPEGVAWAPKGAPRTRQSPPRDFEAMGLTSHEPLSLGTDHVSGRSREHLERCRCHACDELRRLWAG